MEKYRAIEIAELYGVTKMTVYNWIKDGLYYEMEYKPGARPYAVITKEDVDEYIEIKKIQSRK